MNAYLKSNPVVAAFLLSHESGDLYWHLAKRTLGMMPVSRNSWRIVTV